MGEGMGQAPYSGWDQSEFTQNRWEIFQGVGK